MLHRTLNQPIAWLASTLLPAVALAAPDLSGTWEVQSMGGDREVRIEQQGNKVMAHRILWPEFEGQKYKLEHLYRGQLSDNKIVGDLLVKEDEVPTFEVLRTFTGNVTSDQKITLDGLPMKRTGKPAGGATSPTEPAMPAPKNTERPSDSPGVAQAKPPPPPPTAPGGTEKPSPAPESGGNLFADILGSPGMSGMFEIALKADIPEEAKDLTDEADRLYGNDDYAGALSKYQAAQKAAGGPRVEFLRRIGRCHLKLNQFDEATEVLKRALRLDPANVELKKDYKRAVDKSGRTQARARSKTRGGSKSH